MQIFNTNIFNFETMIFWTIVLKNIRAENVLKIRVKKFVLTILFLIHKNTKLT